MEERQERFSTVRHSHKKQLAAGETKVETVLE